MFNTKYILSLIIIVVFLILTSFIKNETRILEKKKYNLITKLKLLQKDINETQLDFYYLTTPLEIEKRLNTIGFENYEPIKYSNIYFNISDFTKIQNKITNINDLNEKKSQKN